MAPKGRLTLGVAWHGAGPIVEAWVLMKEDDQVAPLVRGMDWMDWQETVVDGSPAFYGEAGSGPPALFLHGWGLDHKATKRALSRLVRAGLHVYAPALPGFGGTAGLDATSIGLSSYSDWVATFLDTVGVLSPVLALGHSFGGGVAVTLAHDHRRHVHSPGAHQLRGRFGLGTQRLHRALHGRAAAVGLGHPLPGRPASHSPATQHVLPVILAEGLPNLIRDPRSFWLAAGLARRADLTEELDVLRRRRLPVVVLWGQHDHLVTRASFEDMCRCLGCPDVVTVPGNHSWLLADPPGIR